jgi:hypothetical protein
MAAHIGQDPAWWEEPDDPKPPRPTDEDEWMPLMLLPVELA